jgi:3-phenylpropionate/trans-cinnamate dioxygenase ferredoxin reductase subunit
MSEHFVIVGAGQAGSQAVATLRSKGFTGRLTLIGKEAYLPYQRPPLSKKFLAGELAIERLLLKPAAFYADRDITVRLDATADSLDLHARTLTLDSGETIAYEKLLLTTGSRVRRLTIPGHDLPGIHYLRNIADVIGIQRDLKPGQRLLLVGGGYIGLEVAAVAVQLGLQVTVLEALDRLMARVVSPAVSAFFQRRHEAAGVTIVSQARATGFVGRHEVTGVQTDSVGQVPCDLVIAGIGVEPEIALAEQAGLRCDNGICVDEFCRTSDPHVFAAGDCTSHPSIQLGRRLRLESVANALAQGRAAALNMLESKVLYDELPWFWSDQYELKLQIAGLAQQDHQQVMRGEPAEGSFAVFYLADGRMTAVEAVNRPRAFMAGKKLISAGAPVSEHALAQTDRTMHDIAREALERTNSR